MTKKDSIYKCNICGNVVEVLEGYAGALVCCGKEMQLMDAQTADMATEKHVPVIEVDGNKIKVTVGSTLHPMTEEHYIELIELVADGKVLASYRPSPGEQPIVEWCLEKVPENLTAREYCNVHGLWKN